MSPSDGRDAAADLNLGDELDRIVAMAGGTESYASHLDPEGDERIARARASAMAFAASLWSLVDVPRAVICFQSAADDFSRLDPALAVPLAICADPFRPRDLRDPGQLREGPELGMRPECLVLQVAWMQNDRSVDNTFWGETALPVGRTRAPLAAYLEVASAIEAARRGAESDPGRLAGALRAFLARTGEATRAAMTDSYHWRRLGSGLFPVEPEVVATCALALTAAPEHELEVELEGAEMAPFLVAERLVRFVD